MGGARGLLMSIVTLVACAAIGDQLRARLVERMRKVTEISDVYALPPPVYVKTLAIGYDDAVASVLWASTLYQYGERVGKNRRFEYPTQYLETILELDPAFRPAYRFASTLATMQAVAPERVTLDRVRALLERGTQELPHDPETWGAYASFMMFEGAQFLDEKEKSQWRVTGAHAAQRAVELGYKMSTISVSGAIFLERAGERDLAIAQLERAYAVAPDDDTRQRIVAKLRRLKAQESIARIEQTQRFFLDAWRTQLPWTSESLFVLVGPRRDVASCAGISGEDPGCAPGWTGASSAVASSTP